MQIGLRLGMLALLVVLAGYQGAVTWQYVDQARWPENVIDAEFGVGRPWPAIVHARGRAAEAGLRDGERLVEVQGKPYTNERERARELDRLFPGDRVRVTVTGSDGRPREVSWRLAAADGGKISLLRMARLGASIALPWICLGLGFAGVWRRPDVGRKWLRLWIWTALTHWIAPPAFFGSGGWAAAVSYEWDTAMRGMLSVFLMRLSWKDWRVAAGLTLTVLPMVAVSSMSNWGEAERWAGWIDGIGPAAETVEWIRLGAAGCALALTWRRS